MFSYNLFLKSFTENLRGYWLSLTLDHAILENNEINNEDLIKFALIFSIKSLDSGNSDL